MSAFLSTIDLIAESYLFVVIWHVALNADMKWLLSVVIGTLVCISVADNENARLLASKNILNMYMVENKDLTVEYQIYNVGGRYSVYASVYSYLTDSLSQDVCDRHHSVTESYFTFDYVDYTVS